MYFFVVITALLVSSCTKKIEKKEYQNYWRQYEARLYDIPITINAKPLSEYCTQCEPDQAIQLGYSTALSKENIIKFYQQEMERMGWLEYGIVCGYEFVVQFEKPRRFCTVSIRDDEYKHRRIVVVSVGLKK